MKFFNDCSVTREEVINIVNSYVTNVKNEITGTIIPCADTVCDDVSTLKIDVDNLEAVNHRFFISDGVTTEEINIGETVNLLEDVDTKVKPFVSASNNFGFTIDTTGATDNQVFTYDSGTGTIVWQDITSIITPVDTLVGNTLFVSKQGDDATGVRENKTKHYLTLNAAIADAQSGDTIIVSNGVYNETNTNINSINNALTSLNIVLEDTVTLNTFIECASKDLSIVGKNSTLDGGVQSALHFTGIGTTNLFVDLFKVTSSVGSSTIYIDNVNSADLNIHYLFNLKPNNSGGNPLTLGAFDTSTISYKGFQNYLANNNITGLNIQINNASVAYLDIDKLYTSVNSGGVSVTASTTNEHFINIKNAFIGQEGIKVTDANAVFDIEKLQIAPNADSGIKLRGTDSLNRTKVTFKDCEISGDVGGISQTNFSNSLILIGVLNSDVDDYVDLKIKNCTLSNINADANSGCIAVKGACGSNSNAIIFSQNSHYFTNGTYPFETLYYTFGTCYLTNNVEVQLIGSTTSNKALALAGPYYAFNTTTLAVIDASFTNF